MADEVNKAAFEGGDTHPDVAKEIHARNKAMQEASDKQREVGKKLEEARQEAYDANIEAERKVAKSTQALVTGAPVGSPDQPSVENYGGTAAKNREQKESGKKPDAGGGRLQEDK